MIPPTPTAPVKIKDATLIPACLAAVFATVPFTALDAFSFTTDFAISEAFWTFPASPEFALAAEGCSIFLLSVAIASLVPTGIVLSEVVEIPDSIIFCKDCISDTPTDILSSLRSRYRKNTNGATV